MSSHNEQVQPAAFDVATPAPAETARPAAQETEAQRPGWMVPALLGLAVVAVLVVFWLPGRVGTAKLPPQVSEQASEPSKVLPQKPGEQAAEASPWSDAQLAKLRGEAQDVLGELLEIQELLEDIGVELWALEPYELAKVAATQGDNEYREREFVAAKASYEQSLAGLKTILESEPDVLEAHLAQAREAIEKGDRELADSALVVARAIEPENEELRALDARAATLEQLLPLVSQAQEAEKSGDLASAEALLTQAVALDPEHKTTSAELERVTAAHTALKFNDAMSDGYSALDDGNFSGARAAFKRAAGLSAGSQEAASALLEVQVAQTDSRLSSLQTKGRVAEEKEQWAEAVTAYEQAIGIDPNILYAHEGLKRSRIRAKLDQQFSMAIDEPERLAVESVAEATATLLRQASTLSPKGPLLSRQMSQLEILLKQANTVLPLTLRSDGETEVIVYKVARLGRFEQQQLSLRPGKYTAVGTRTGYRDVRVTFKLNHNGPLPSVIVSCTEQI
jgi:tetratricopeptide (TPR) repeat protein